MTDVKIRTVKLPHALPDLPGYANLYDACVDLCAALPTVFDPNEELHSYYDCYYEMGDAPGLVIPPGHRVLVPTGLTFEIPEGLVGLVFPRSGNAIKRGLGFPNSVGVIDSGYRGEVMVPVINLDNKPLKVSRGERIAQMLVIPRISLHFEEATELSDSARGEGGFGSSGQ